MLRYIMLWTHTLVWQKSYPSKKSEIHEWRSNQPELFYPPFMEKPDNKPKDQVAMDIDEMKAFLNKPRKGV